MGQDGAATEAPNEVASGDRLNEGSSGASAARPRDAGGPLRHLRQFVVGFFMGSAEVVPGVSGGTVALVGGIYTRLIDAVRDAVNVGLSGLRGRRRELWPRAKALDWALLIPLGIGMALAVLTLARVIKHFMSEEPIAVAGLFLGLVLGSMVVAYRMLRRVSWETVAIVIGVAVVMFLLLGLHEETEGQAGDVATAPLWAYPLAMSVAICAWILPGVSGSLMLVMMGMYSDVFGALNDRDLLPIALSAVGAIVGLAAFSKLLAWLLANHHDRMVAAMIGLMIGSVRVLWPWPGGIESTTLGMPRAEILVPVALAVIGFTVVAGLGILGLAREQPAPE